MDKNDPKIKSSYIYLKICTLVNLRVLNTKMTLLFKDSISKMNLNFGGTEIEISPELLENVYTTFFISN